MSAKKRDQGSRFTPAYAWLTLISFLLTIAILVTQCVTWFQTGDWRFVSILRSIEIVEIYEGSETQFYQIRGWLEQWSGLRETLDWFPIAGVFAIMGLFWLALAATD